MRVLRPALALLMLTLWFLPWIAVDCALAGTGTTITVVTQSGLDAALGVFRPTAAGHAANFGFDLDETPSDLQLAKDLGYPHWRPVLHRAAASGYFLLLLMLLLAPLAGSTRSRQNRRRMPRRLRLYLLLSVAVPACLLLYAWSGYDVLVSLGSSGIGLAARHTVWFWVSVVLSITLPFVTVFDARRSRTTRLGVPVMADPDPDAHRIAAAPVTPPAP